MTTINEPSDDWNAPTCEDWSAEPTRRTFKHDLQGFVYHLVMIALIGSAAAAAWQFGFIPQPVLRIQVQQVQS